MKSLFLRSLCCLALFAVCCAPTKETMRDFVATTKYKKLLVMPFDPGSNEATTGDEAAGYFADQLTELGFRMVDSHYVRSLVEARLGETGKINTNDLLKIAKDVGVGGVITGYVGEQKSNIVKGDTSVFASAAPSPTPYNYNSNMVPSPLTTPLPLGASTNPNPGFPLASPTPYIYSMNNGFPSPTPFNYSSNTGFPSATPTPYNYSSNIGFPSATPTPFNYSSNTGLTNPMSTPLPVAAGPTPLGSNPFGSPYPTTTSTPLPDFFAPISSDKVVVRYSAGATLTDVDSGKIIWTGKKSNAYNNSTLKGVASNTMKEMVQDLCIQLMKMTN